MLVKYSIQNTGPKGLGVVAEEDIPKGTAIWSLEKAKVNAFSNEKEFTDFLDKQSPEEQLDTLKFAYCCSDKVYLLQDDSRFINHDPEAFNMAETHELDTLYATKDIKKGEEIAEDYGVYQKIPWFEKIALERGATSCLKLLEDLNDPRFISK